MRKWVGIVVAFAVGAMMAVPLALAISGSGSGKLDTQVYADRNAAVSTSSKSFVKIPGLTRLICAQNEVAATVSGNAFGAGFALQVRVDDAGIMEPGVAYVYSPQSGVSKAFSVTFVFNAQPFEANDHHSFDVEWRSLTGQSVTLQRGVLNLQFENGTHMCP